MKLFHPSLEGAQHGDKSLNELIVFAKNAGAVGVQPSNFHLQSNPDGTLMSVESVKEIFEQHPGFKLDGISVHCPTWVHTSAWTCTKTIRPFIPVQLLTESPTNVEKWMETYILKLLDLAAALDVKVVPMFWGVAFGWEVATGYPWGMWSGPTYDLIEEGKERFVNMTARIRGHANDLGIVLAHEIHPGTAAMTADDFLMLVAICDGDSCLGVNADLTHCWEGEHWRTRFTKVADRIAGCHMKNHIIKEGMALRCMEPNWRKRPMQFTRLDMGDLDLLRYVELMADIGYPQRYLALMGSDTAPLVGEAEGAYEDLNDIAASGIKWIAEKCCFDVAKGSFEDAMGA